MRTVEFEALPPWGVQCLTGALGLTHRLAIAIGLRIGETWVAAVPLQRRTEDADDAILLLAVPGEYVTAEVRRAATSAFSVETSLTLETGGGRCAVSFLAMAEPDLEGSLATLATLGALGIVPAGFSGLEGAFPRGRDLLAAARQLSLIENTVEFGVAASAVEASDSPAGAGQASAPADDSPLRQEDGASARAEAQLGHAFTGLSGRRVLAAPLTEAEPPGTRRRTTVADPLQLHRDIAAYWRLAREGMTADDIRAEGPPSPPPHSPGSQPSDLRGAVLPRSPVDQVPTALGGGPSPSQASNPRPCVAAVRCLYERRSGKGAGAVRRGAPPADSSSSGVQPQAKSKGIARGEAAARRSPGPFAAAARLDLVDLGGEYTLTDLLEAGVEVGSASRLMLAQALERMAATQGSSSHEDGGGLQGAGGSAMAGRVLGTPPLDGWTLMHLYATEEIDARQLADAWAYLGDPSEHDYQLSLQQLWEAQEGYAKGEPKGGGKAYYW